MKIIGIVLIALGVAVLGFVVYRLLASGKSSAKGNKKDAKTAQVEAITETANTEVERIFNAEFREELRNRGRLYFEKIINENAMFLQQDLRITTSQLNDYMKNEINKVLQEEFSKYEESIDTAKKIAMETIQKTQTVIEEQRAQLEKQMMTQVEQERATAINRFAQNMTDILNHYVLEAIGDQIDLNDQLEYIVADLEANKEAILRDMVDGA